MATSVGGSAGATAPAVPVHRNPPSRPGMSQRQHQLLTRGLWSLSILGASLLLLYPFVWLVSASLKPRSQVFDNSLVPNPFAPENYVTVWKAAPLVTWMVNSVVVGLVAAIAVTVSSAVVAFGFAYFRFRWRGPMFALVLGTMMLPGAVTMVPTYLIWDRLGLASTQVPLWAGKLFGSIALPLAKPALVIVFVFELRASWTDLVKPLIYLRDPALYTIPRGLKAVIDQFGKGGESQWEIVLAASVLTTLPMIVLFFLGQRHFVEGIATTGRGGA